MQGVQWRNRLQGGGARLRIGLAFSALAIVLFGGVGYFSGRAAWLQSEREAAAALQQVADRLAQRLDADMAARYRDIDQLAQLIDLMALQPDPARWRELLEQVQQSSHHYSWIGVTDRQGKVMAATQGLLEAVDVSQRPWFAQGLQQTSVLGVHDAKLLASLLPAPASGEPLRFVDVAAPLKQQGQTVGVIGAHLSWEWADQRRREALAAHTARAGIEIVLTTDGGDIELGPREPALGEGARQTMRTLLRTPQPLQWSDGQRYLTATSASKAMGDYPGMDWWVVVRQPEALAMAEPAALARRLLWTTALGVALFGGLGWLLADKLTRPLRQVAAHARALMPHAGPQPHDEVDQLAQSLSGLLADLKQRESELTALNAALESRVQARTASLKQANEDLRAFSRSVSHDIQGPLGSMALLMRQTLAAQGDALPAGVQRTMGLVAQECERLRHLSAELLALAMVEQREMACERVDHAALVAEVLDELRAAATGRFPDVVVGELPVSCGDPLMLRQVWANLLSNAVKFSGKADAPRIEVRAEAQGDHLVFTVADNGVGFDEAQASRLFGVFQRLHKASQFPGTGVGLSIVRRVVERHGGRVWATSPAGAGARFHVELPTQACEDKADPA